MLYNFFALLLSLASCMDPPLGHQASIPKDPAQQLLEFHLFNDQLNAPFAQQLLAYGAWPSKETLVMLAHENRNKTLDAFFAIVEDKRELATMARDILVGLEYGSKDKQEIHAIVNSMLHSGFVPDADLTEAIVRLRNGSIMKAAFEAGAAPTSTHYLILMEYRDYNGIRTLIEHGLDVSGDFTAVGPGDELQKGPLIDILMMRSGYCVGNPDLISTIQAALDSNAPVGPAAFSYAALYHRLKAAILLLQRGAIIPRELVEKLTNSHPTFMRALQLAQVEIAFMGLTQGSCDPGAIISGLPSDIVRTISKVVYEKSQSCSK